MSSGGHGRWEAQEGRRPKSSVCRRVSLSSSRAHVGWQGGHSPRLGGGARGASLSCAPCPPKAGCQRSPQGAALQAPAGSVQRECWPPQGPICGGSPSPLWPTRSTWCPWPGAMSLLARSPCPGPRGAGLSGDPHLQSWGVPRLPSTSVPGVLLIQYSQQQLSLQAAGWSPGSGADSPEAGV